MDFSILLWIFIIAMSFTPVLKQQQLEAQRLKLIRMLERKRNSRFISLIHREEAISFFGLAFRKYINIEDSEQILRAIRFTPDDMPLDVILHTPGGLVLASEQIACALKKHPGKVTVFVPHYAMSGGTMIALSADEIVMDENAVLGPVDPQLGEYPAASILKVMETKTLDEVDDRTVILADISRKAIRQVRKTLSTILESKMEHEKAEALADRLSRGEWTHDYPIRYEELKEMGLPVIKDMPEEIYRLMDLYPQAKNNKPSVQYIPLPYDSKNRNK